MAKAKHKLTLLDRLRGWHWATSLWFDYHGDYVGTFFTRRWNYCEAPFRRS